MDLLHVDDVFNVFLFKSFPPVQVDHADSVESFQGFIKPLFEQEVRRLLQVPEQHHQLDQGGDDHQTTPDYLPFRNHRKQQSPHQCPDGKKYLHYHRILLPLLVAQHFAAEQKSHTVGRVAAETTQKQSNPNRNDVEP